MSLGCAGLRGALTSHQTPSWASPGAQPLRNPLLNLAQFAVLLGLVWVPPAATGSALTPGRHRTVPMAGCQGGDTRPAPGTATVPWLLAAFSSQGIIKRRKEFPKVKLHAYKISTNQNFLYRIPLG